MITAKAEFEVLTIVLAIIEAITFAWAWQERQRNRDFKQKAEEWAKIVQGMANACTVMKDDCKEGGRVTSVKDAGGRIDTLGSFANSLHDAMQVALKETEGCYEAIKRTLKETEGNDP
jgi:hypothetical protein